MTARVDGLTVFLFAEPVGILRESEGRLAFAYSESWLADPEALPLSLSLPLVEGSQDGGAFFANLLPEGGVREHYAQKLRIPVQDDFALLAALGGECAGAVSLYPEGEAPYLGRQPDYRKLTADEVRLVLDEPIIVGSPLLGPGEAARLSLAGVQDKLPVALFDEEIFLPLNGAPSTHILKPQHHRFPELVENEAFCMTLAARLGVDVPRATILPVAEGAYLVERYDRVVTGTTVRRVHQEDFCQALGVPHTRKYESFGGPGLADCFRVLNKSREPIPDQRRMVRLAIFNYLIGNADAHAKNLSLLYPWGRAPSLAPAYDLVCTSVYPGLSVEMAMSLGKVANPAMVGKTEWKALATEAGWRSDRFVLASLEEMADGLLREAPMLARDMRRDHGACDIYGEMLRLMEQRARSALRSLQTG